MCSNHTSIVLGGQHSSLLEFESDLFKAKQENLGKKSFISNFERERERMESIRWKCGMC